VVASGHAIGRKDEAHEAAAAQLRAHDHDVTAPLELAAESTV
jgi:hypothetical protein